MYLRANTVITAVQQGTEVPQVIADGIHRGIVFDVDINERCDECSRQLLASDHYILKTCSLHLFLKLLQMQKKQKMAVRNEHRGNIEELTLCTRFLAENQRVLYSGRHVDEYAVMMHEHLFVMQVEAFVHTFTFGSSDIMRLN